MCSRLLANLDASQTNKQTKQSQKKQKKTTKEQKNYRWVFHSWLVSLVFIEDQMT